VAPPRKREGHRRQGIAALNPRCPRPDRLRRIGRRQARGDRGHTNRLRSCGAKTQWPKCNVTPAIVHREPDESATDAISCEPPESRKVGQTGGGSGAGAQTEIAVRNAIDGGRRDTLYVPSRVRAATAPHGAKGVITLTTCLECGLLMHEGVQHKCPGRQ
jgi:hypothetical protein